MAETETSVPMDDAALYGAAMAADTPAETPESPQPEPQAQPESTERPRDEHGRFAPREAQPDAQSTPQPVQSTPPTADTGQDEGGAVPAWRLREIRMERDQERERVAAAQRERDQLAAEVAAMRRHIAQVTAQPQPPKPKPDFFENPDAATTHTVESMLNPQMSAIERRLTAFGKMLAHQAHGADKVQEAERAFIEAMDRRTLDPADYQRVMNAENMYDAAVQWHKRQTALATVGDDPAAYFQRTLDERMKDPAFQAELLKRVQAGAQAAPANGQRPVVQLPPSLNRVTAAAPNAAEAAGDLSDESLFRHAMGR